MSKEKEIYNYYQAKLAALCPGFAVYALADARQELPDKFVAIDVGLLNEESPGTGLYRVKLGIHLGTRRTGDGADADGSALDAAYEAVRADFAHVKLDIEVSPNWWIVAVLGKEHERQSNDSHAVNVLNFELCIINAY